MPKKSFFGVSNKARKIKKLYIGVNGKARKVKKAYIGVNGKARLFFSASNVEESATDMILSVTFLYDHVIGWSCTVTCPDGDTLYGSADNPGETIKFYVRQYGTYSIRADNDDSERDTATVTFSKGGETKKSVSLSV